MIAFNCQKDDAVDFNNTKNKSITTTNVLSLDELRNLPMMAGKFSNIRTKDNDTVTKMYSAKYNFSIDTERVMLVQKGDYHSFSFPVIRLQPSGKLENLFLHPHNGGYLPYLLKYNLDAKDMLDFAAGVPIHDLAFKMEIFPLYEFDMVELGLPIETFETTTYDVGDPFMYNGVCSNLNDVVIYDDGSWSASIVACGCQCPEEGGSGGSSSGGSAGTSPVYFALIDLGGGSSGGGGGSGGGGSGGGGSGGSGSGNIWNPGGTLNPPNDTNPNNPGFGNPQNGNPVIGVIGDGATLNISNTIKKPCQKGIVNDVLGVSSPFISVIKSTFDSNQNVNLKFRNADVPDGNAYTTFPPQSEINSGTYVINIVYDNAYLNKATDLSIVAVTIHEMVHAYLRDLYIKGQLTALDSNYESLFNAYIQFYKYNDQMTFDELDNLEHNAIADFMNKMANTIYNYAVSKNIPNVTPEYCLKLAWGTNTGYQSFQTLLTPQQQLECNNIYAYEQDGTTQAKGTPCP